MSFKSAISHYSQYPRAAMLWIGEVEDAESIDDIITSALLSWDPIPDFENLNFKITSELRKIQTWNFKKTSHHRWRQSSVREAITYRLLGRSTTFFIFSGENEAILDFRDEPFDTKWDEVWSQHLATRSTTIADWSWWPKEVLEQKNQGSSSQTRNRRRGQSAEQRESKGKLQNKMPNTTPREETAFVGSRKANVHQEKHAHSSVTRTRKQREGTTSFTFSDGFTAPKFESWRKR